MKKLMYRLIKPRKRDYSQSKSIDKKPSELTYRCSLKQQVTRNSLKTVRFIITRQDDTEFRSLSRGV